MPFAQLDNIRFHYQQSGEGPDLILLHGVTGDLSIWFLSKTMQTLAADFRVTAYDLRGHGYSDAPPTNYTSADQAGDLLAMMDHLGIERASVVGHSFGGVIAAHAAAIAPERFDRLVLSDPYFPVLRHLEDISRWGHWESFRVEALEAGVELTDEFWYDIGHFFEQVQHLEGDRLLKFRQSVGLPTLGRLLRLGTTTCGDDTKADGGLTAEMINGLSHSVLALYGEFSPFLSTSHYLVEHLPNCRGEIVPKAKHRAPEETPEAFVECLSRFLREESPTAAEAELITNLTA